MTIGQIKGGTNRIVAPDLLPCNDISGMAQEDELTPPGYSSEGNVRPVNKD